MEYIFIQDYTLHFSMPRTHYAQDIVFERDTPMFCTSKSEIVSIKRGVVDEMETQMMSFRWRVFSIVHCNSAINNELPL